MNKLTKWLVVLGVAIAMPWQIINAQGLSGENGYVNFGNLTGVYGEPKVQINLGKAMLGFVAGAAEQEDPEISQLLSKLKSVRVLVYDIETDAKAALNTVDRVTNDIQNEGWETIVSVNEENEKVRIYAKMTEDKIDGLVVMAVDGSPGEKSEAVFINIIGQIDPAQVGRVTRSLDIDVDLASGTATRD